MAFTSGRSAVAGLLTTWLNRQFVSELEWSLQYQKFTTKAIIPPGSGKIGRFNVFVEPPTNASYSTTGTTALNETSTTENQITDITANSTDVTISEYGEWLKTSELAMYAAVPGTRERLTKRLKDGAQLVIDELVRLQAIRTTNYIYCTAAQTGGTTTFNTGTVTAMNTAALVQAHKILVSNKAKGFTGISGHPNGHYAAILSPKAELDVVTEVTTGRIYWSNAVVNVSGALGQEKFVNGYIGSVYGVAVYITQNFGTGITYSVSSTADIQMVLADGAVGAMAFRDMQPEVVINDVNSPWKNVDSIAWHIFFGTQQIDGARSVKIYSATT